MAKKSSKKSFFSRAVSKVKQVASNIKTGFGVVKQAAKTFTANLPSIKQVSKNPYSSIAAVGGATRAAVSSVKSNVSTKPPALTYTASSYPPSARNPKSTSGPVKLGPAPRPSGGGSSTPLRLATNTSNSAYDSGVGLSQEDLSYYANQAPPPTYTARSLSSRMGATEDAGGSTGGVSFFSAPSAPDYNSDIDNTNAMLGVGTPIVQQTENPAPVQQTAEQAYADYVKQQKKSERQYEEDLEESYLRAERESGILAKRQQMQNTQNQITNIKAKRDAQLLAQRESLAQSGGTLAAYGGIEDRINREAAINLIPLQAQLAIDQGDVQMAEERMNTLYSIYSKQIEANRNYRERLMEKNWDIFTAKEKATLDARNKQLAREEDLMDDEISRVQQWATDALKSGNKILATSLNKLRPPTNASSPDFAKAKANYIADAQKLMERYWKAGGGTSTKLGSQDRQTLLGVGLTDQDINSIQNDISAYGLDSVLEGITDTRQKQAIRKVYAGDSDTGEQFITTDYIATLFTDDALKQEAEKAGFRSFWSTWGAEKKNYLNYLYKIVEQYRTAGYSDKEIIKMMQ